MRRLLPFLLAAAALVAPVRPAPAAEARLVPGMPLPAIHGEDLDGRDVVMPGMVRGKAALVAFGFSYASRKPVEAWAARWKSLPRDTSRVLIEVPVFPLMARIAKPFITGAMRKGTPAEEHRDVLLAWSDSGPWKQRLNVHDAAVPVMVLLDRAGIVRWIGTGGPGEAEWTAMTRALETLR